MTMRHLSITVTNRYHFTHNISYILEALIPKNLVTSLPQEALSYKYTIS